jgi:hypothetical protein
MSITLTTGSTMSIAKTYSPALGSAGTTITAISNASPASVTATHSLSIGDYVLISSSWGLLDGRVCRVLGVTGTTAFTLEGVDTSDTAKYPATTGVPATFRKIATWTQLSQVKGVSASGGAQQFADITSITDTVKRQIPTIKDAVAMTIDVYDDPTLSWYADVSAADDARSPYALKMDFANGSKLVANAYWSILDVPTMAQNEALMTQISLSYAAEPIRYST